MVKPDEVKEKCFTCFFHEGGWQNCNCMITLSAFHQERCINDNIQHCIFYKPKQNTHT